MALTKSPSRKLAKLLFSPLRRKLAPRSAKSMLIGHHDHNAAGSAALYSTPRRRLVDPCELAEECEENREEDVMFDNPFVTPPKRKGRNGRVGTTTLPVKMALAVDGGISPRTKFITGMAKEDGINEGEYSYPSAGGGPNWLVLASPFVSPTKSEGSHPPPPATPTSPMRSAWSSNDKLTLSTQSKNKVASSASPESIFSARFQESPDSAMAKRQRQVRSYNKVLKVLGDEAVQAWKNS